MNVRLDRQLIKDFPLTFRKRKLSDTESCMGRGFTIDDGWYLIVRDVAAIAEQDIKSRNHRCCVAQVKEKLGTLRIYFENAEDNFLMGVAAMAEAISARTCEVCGTTKDVKRHKLFGFYLKTVCPKCKKLVEKRHK